MVESGCLWAWNGAESRIEDRKGGKEDWVEVVFFSLMVNIGLLSSGGSIAP